MNRILAFFVIHMICVNYFILCQNNASVVENTSVKNDTYNYELLNSDIGANSNNSLSRSGRTYFESSPETANGPQLPEKIAESVAEVPKLGWISKPLREGLSDLRVKSETNDICNLHINLYETHLKNYTLWAVRMAESSQSELVGLLSGTTYQMGNFEECVNTNVPTHGIRGKYCLANFKYRYSKSAAVEEHLKNFLSPEVPDISQDTSVWEGLTRLSVDPTRIDRQELHWGLCIPESCSADDLALSLNKSLLARFKELNLELDITVDPTDCSVAPECCWFWIPFVTNCCWLPFTFPKGFWITILCFGFFLMVNILSTLWDVYDYLVRLRQKKYKDDSATRTNEKTLGFWRKLVGAFSIWRNVRSLLCLDKKDSHQIKSVNFLKVLMMVLIIFSHILLCAFGDPQFNPEKLEKMYHQYIYQGIARNLGITDSFLMITGFLTFYFGYTKMKKNGVAHLIQKIVFRYFRLIPLLGVVIAYVIFILPYTSDGPIWKTKISVETENCKKNWWLNILLLNNIVNVDEQCYVVSWYITNDILLYASSAILMYLMSKSRKYRFYLPLLMLLAGMAYTFWIVYSKNMYGIFRVYMRVLEDLRKNIEYRELYVVMSSRVGPYVVGLLTAYFTMKLQERKFMFSTKGMIVATIFFAGINQASSNYGIQLYWVDRPYYALENAFYACIQNILYVSFFAWIILAHETSGFGNALNSVIGHIFFTVFAKLSYSVFLMHLLVQLTITASLRTPIFYSHITIAVYCISSLAISYICAIIFYILAEAPVCGVSKLLEESFESRFQKKRSEAKETSTINGNKNGILLTENTEKPETIIMMS